ncbi:MAG: hypothetical protein FJX19_10520, partial [Alphaproteobacteria bacterium]|nr:hypothetical protein [Alphaproteobacteria bacterium]
MRASSASQRWSFDFEQSKTRSNARAEPTRSHRCNAGGLTRILRGHKETIGERLQRDLVAMRPLPAAPFEACDQAG